MKTRLYGLYGITDQSLLTDLPALLAACGAPTVSHGVDSVGPKFGITHRHVLAAAGVPVDLTTEQAAARLADPDAWLTRLWDATQKEDLAELHRLVDAADLEALPARSSEHLALALGRGIVFLLQPIEQGKRS